MRRPSFSWDLLSASGEDSTEIAASYSQMLTLADAANLLLTPMTFPDASDIAKNVTQTIRVG